VAGLGRWAGADIEEFLASGKTGKYAAFGEMGAVVLHSTQFMAPADRDAIVSFLQTLPPAAFEVAIAGARSASASPADGSDVRAGAQTYLADCADCHAAAGTGHASSFPALAGNPVVNTSDPASLIHIVLAGGAEVHTRDASSSLVMPPFGKSLSDAEIADLLTYVRSSWGNHAPPVSPDQVKTLRRKIGQAEPAGK
jgi:mono/diheme cytochrome c family protein